ncbi:MAG: clan AA aspartic protease [bacterium]|nr:clan AA aspartic protease [bacterium]
MGETHVMVTVRNPLDRQRYWEGEFLVDTGAVDSLVPRRALEAIGVQSRGPRTYRLADGSAVEFEIAFAELEFMEDVAPARVIVGDDEAEPLLGVIALEQAGVLVDPEGEKLRRREFFRL